MGRIRGFLAPLFIGLAIAFIVSVLGHTDFMSRLELRLLDYRVVLREACPLAPVPVSKDIVLVLIDQPTMDRLKKPIALWLPYFSRAFKGMFDGGAAVVGVDMILGYADHTQFAEFGRTLLPFVDRLVLAGFLVRDDMSGATRIDKPADDLVALVTTANIGLANMTRDADGVLRAQKIDPFEGVDNVERYWNPFAALLAEKFSAKKIDALRAAFGDKRLPLEDGRLLINYTGSAPPFRRIPFLEVWLHAEKRDIAWLRTTFNGKAVLVGPGSSTFQDIVETPFNVADRHPSHLLVGTSVSHSMLGVEAHANVLNTLLTGAWLYRADPWTNFLFLVVVCVASALLSARLSAGRGLTLGLVLMGLVCLFGVWEFSARRVWLDLASPLVAVPLVWGGVYGFRHAVEEREKRVIRGLFGQYVAPQVMEELLRNPESLKLGGERRNVTVLFSDINGFTTRSESSQPEEVVRMLNAYFEEMARIVFKHAGTLESFVGDEIMVLFGAPQAHPNAEQAAVATAIEMIRKLAEMRRVDKDETHGFYRVKIGIHTGTPIAGNIGSMDRRQYTVIGDAVNLTSRIMNMCKEVGAEILISEATYERVKEMDGVEFIDRGKHAVRGRQNQVGIYEIRQKNGQEVDIAPPC